MRHISVPARMAVMLAVIFAFILLAIAERAEAQTVKVGQTFRDCLDCPEMVVLPAGNFLMGLSDVEAKRDTQQEPLLDKILNQWHWTKSAMPQHPVKIQKPFGLGKYPVTRGEFAVFAREMGFSTDQPCQVPTHNKLRFSAEAGWRRPGYDQSDRDPVVCVSWDEAHAYVAWLNVKLARGNAATPDRPYRLPSEAEWEYAARAGTQTTRWWGDAIGSNKAVCNHCGSPWDNQQPAPIGSYGSNDFGLGDMLGNVWQWTEDCWNGNYAGAPENGSAWQTGNCAQKVLRGGGWLSDPAALTSASRAPAVEGLRANFDGFRVAKELSDTPQNSDK